MPTRKLDPYTLLCLARRFKKRSKDVLARMAAAGNNNHYSTGRALELDMQGDNLRFEVAALTRPKPAMYFCCDEPLCGQCAHDWLDDLSGSHGHTIKCVPEGNERG